MAWRGSMRRWDYLAQETRKSSSRPSGSRRPSVPAAAGHGRLGAFPFGPRGALADRSRPRAGMRPLATCPAGCISGWRNGYASRVSQVGLFSRTGRTPALCSACASTCVSTPPLGCGSSSRARMRGCPAIVRFQTRHITPTPWTFGWATWNLVIRKTSPSVYEWDGRGE